MKKIVMTALFAALLAAPVFAAETYVGISAGQNKMDYAAAPSTTAFSLFGGYAFNEYIAGELAYINFGSGDTSATTPVTLKGSAASISAVGSLPLGKAFALFAKLGFATTSLDASTSGVTVSQTKSDTTYGLGAQYNATRNIGVRLGYDNYKVGDPTSKDSALTSLGVLFKF